MKTFQEFMIKEVEQIEEADRSFLADFKEHKALLKFAKTVKPLSYKNNGKVISFVLPLRGFKAKDAVLANDVCSDWTLSTAGSELVVHLRNYKQVKSLNKV
jgi:hypothetical protein